MRRKHGITVTLAAATFLLGCELYVASAFAQSLTDRFKSLFGGKSEQPAQTAAPIQAEPRDELDCPPVAIRAGASTYAVAAPGKQPVGNDVRFQATITKTARECIKAGAEITARIGIQGRVIVGPAGAPSNVEVPMRVAVVEGGIGEKVIVTKTYKTNVTVNQDESASFTIVADDLAYPAPAANAADNYIFYVGFDPQLVSRDKPKPTKKKK